MSVPRMIGWFSLTALLVACNAPRGLTALPSHTGAAGSPTVSGDVLSLSAEEAEAARSPQPALHALATKQVFDALIQHHPEAADRLRTLEQRSLALSRLQLRAAHALAFEEMMTMTLADVVALMQRWVADPRELIGYTQSILDRVQGLDDRQTVRIARMLPPAAVALEAVGREVPTQPAQAAGVDLRHQLIGDFLAMLKARKPDQAAELDALEQQMKALSPDQIRALRASAWEADKDKTLAQVMDRTTAFIEEPGAYARYLRTQLGRLKGLTAQGLDQLMSHYPPVLARLDDILFGPPSPAPDRTATP